jgi:DNA invertase Pin-like site-specific DNA recombinase
VVALSFRPPRVLGRNRGFHLRDCRVALRLRSFWALDRFSREGMAQTIIHLQRLSSYGVAFHSYTEAHLATDNELVWSALLSSLARVEAQKISERTKAGMARAKAKGIKIGRPKLGLELRQKIAQRVARGEMPYAIAKALGIDRHTAVKYAR